MCVLHRPRRSRILDAFCGAVRLWTRDTRHEIRVVHTIPDMVLVICELLAKLAGFLFTVSAGFCVCAEMLAGFD